MRRIRLGGWSAEERRLIVDLGFGEYGEEDAGGLRPIILTTEGQAFDDAANVYGDKEEAKRLLRAAYLRTPATQVLMQGLHGRGAVQVHGALYLLARHGLASERDIPRFRAMLSVLNTLGVVSYSKQRQTVRITAPMPDADAEPSRIRIIEPDRPYSNIRALRETLRACKGYVWWADPHFEKRGLEPLADEADATKITEMRILSGTRPNPSEASEYKRFAEEMSNAGINVEFRVVAPPDRVWHDRYIITSDRAWNVPGVGVVAKGSYSELTETMPPPFEEWWDRGTPV